jgi:hypothetical protein
MFEFIENSVDEGLREIRLRDQDYLLNWGAIEELRTDLTITLRRLVGALEEFRFWQDATMVARMKAVLGLEPNEEDLIAQGQEIIRHREKEAKRRADEKEFARLKAVLGKDD